LASRKVHAAGAVVWRSSGGTVEVALVYRPRYDDWSLPKGKLDPGESTRVAAWREVREETGARVALGRFLCRTRYRVDKDRKVVTYFAARYVSGAFTPSEEVATVRWLSVSDAASLMSYKHDQKVLAAFTALPADLTTLLLVRHAKAGNRADWPDADELRPLSHNGRKQVPPIRTLGSVYGADQVYAAPLVRCVRTVQPVADDLGVPVVEEELLAEKAYGGMEEATVRRVLEIVASADVPVVCSQGGVIPDLLSRLAAASGLSLGKRIQAKKGSVWALSFDGERLVAADYLQTP
jgi:8-oxo-dGTP pyrophosphatase MutT (NUDIX family)/phosphohistidine phosphatase SixA